MLSYYTPLSLYIVVGVVGVVVVVAGNCLLCEMGFACFYGCPGLSKFLFVYLFQLVFLCPHAVISVGWE